MRNNEFELRVNTRKKERKKERNRKKERKNSWFTWTRNLFGCFI